MTWIAFNVIFLCLQLCRVYTGNCRIQTIQTVLYTHTHSSHTGTCKPIHFWWAFMNCLHIYYRLVRPMGRNKNVGGWNFQSYKVIRLLFCAMAIAFLIWFGRGNIEVLFLSFNWSFSIRYSNSNWKFDLSKLWLDPTNWICSIFLCVFLFSFEWLICMRINWFQNHMKHVGEKTHAHWYCLLRRTYKYLQLCCGLDHKLASKH